MGARIHGDVGWDDNSENGVTSPEYLAGHDPWKRRTLVRYGKSSLQECIVAAQAPFGHKCDTLMIARCAKASLI